MSDELRRLLREVASEAPAGLDAGIVRRAAGRRRAAVLGGGAALAVACAAAAAALLQPVGTDSLGPADPSATPSRTSSEPAPAPTTVFAATGSRVASYRVADGSRSSWLSPEVPGFGAGDLALSATQVLYSLGDGATRRVQLVLHPSPEDSGPGILSDPGGFLPALLPDGSRYGYFATGEDSAYTPASRDLRLILSEMDGGTQAVSVDPEALISGLAFAGTDRLVTTLRGGGTSGLRVYDFQTDQVPLGSRSPDERSLPAPEGCDWSLVTETPNPREVLVLERCDEGSVAVTVDVETGARVVFGVVRPAGPGQVDSLDLDATGRHLVAQVHSGEMPPAPGAGGGSPSGPVLTTRTLEDGRTVTTTEALVSPVWD